MDKRLQQRLNSARNFPANTCAASRHAQMLGEMLVAGKPLTEDIEHCGESILATVAELYETRTERDRLRAAANELNRLTELERRVAKRCAEAVPQWAPELRELLRPTNLANRRPLAGRPVERVVRGLVTIKKG